MAVDWNLRKIQRQSDHVLKCQNYLLGLILLFRKFNILLTIFEHQFNETVKYLELTLGRIIRPLIVKKVARPQKEIIKHAFILYDHHLN